jgi:hypothetical protein
VAVVEETRGIAYVDLPLISEQSNQGQGGRPHGFKGQNFPILVLNVLFKVLLDASLQNALNAIIHGFRN